MSDPNSDNYIPDGSIQASSEFSSATVPSYGRLNGNNYWVPADSDTDPWIQVDIGRLVNVYEIQTQGCGGANWVTTLKVSTFQQVPAGAGDVGDFITYENEIKVLFLYSIKLYSNKHKARTLNQQVTSWVSPTQAG